MPNLNVCLRVGALALTLLFFGACGSDDNLMPYSELYYDGPSPAELVVDVDPAVSRLQYFTFHIELNDPNLSVLPAQDAWTIQGMTGTFTISDPGGHVLAPLPDVDSTTTAQVASRATFRYPISLITDEWMEENAQGFVGTTDEATVVLTGVISTRRNRDGLQRNFPIVFTFTLKDVTA